jgi:hypothetical protein
MLQSARNIPGGEEGPRQLALLTPDLRAMSISSDSSRSIEALHRLDAAHADSPRPAANADESLRSFVLEVSAGRPEGAGEATFAPSRGFDVLGVTRWRKRRGKRRSVASEPDSPTKGGDSPKQQTPSAAKTRSPSVSRDAAAERAAPALQVLSNRAPQHVARTRRKRTLAPVWASSLALHAASIALLGAVSLTGLEATDDILLWASPPAEVDVMLDDVNLDPTDEVSDEISEIVDQQILEDQLIDPGQAALGTLAAEAALAPTDGEAALAAGSLGDVGALFGANGAGLAEFDSGLGDAPIAEFFGQKIDGRRIVFVLDNSGSMQGGRLETVIAELRRAVDSLTPEQEFYVIFHSDAVYPLFYPTPVDRYVLPTDSNKRRLAAWLDTVELCLGDSTDEALAIAAMIEPDTVFLLSDGRIQSEKTMRFLLTPEVRNFPIHTFGVGMGSSVVGRRNLADVAAANGGEFRESEVPDAMRDLARTKLRPYHSDGPGLVWGRKVRAGAFGR